MKKGPSGALRNHLVKWVHAIHPKANFGYCGLQGLKLNELTRFI